MEINLKCYSNLKFKIDTDEYDYLSELNNYFSAYTEGFRFSPLYKTGQWDGKIYMLNKTNLTLPIGLLTDFLRFHKKYFNDYKLNLDEDLKNIIKKEDISNLELEPCKLWDYRDYQEFSIKKAIEYKRGIIRACTGAGKTLIIYGIIKNLLKYQKISNAIIIVPSVSLIKQFYSDIIEYGIDKKDVGMFFSKIKDFDKKITISTWQTLKNRKDIILNYDCVIVDECHGVRGIELSNILQLSEAKYKIGCTGTLPDDQIELWNIKSYLGPVLYEVSTSELADLGYLAQCKVKFFNIYYKKNTRFSRDYFEAVNDIFDNEFRLSFINNLINKLNDTILILVNKVETEGEFLKEVILKNYNIKEENITFISGKMNADIREEWRKKVIKNHDKKYIIIATFGVFQQGINIPNLKYLIFASPTKSKIRLLQSIGRTLRMFTNKEDGAIIYDIVDYNNRWFPKQGDIRLRHYYKEKFEVEEYELKE